MQGTIIHIIRDNIRLIGAPIAPRIAQMRNLFVFLPCFLVIELINAKVAGDKAMPTGPPRKPPAIARKIPFLLRARVFILYSHL